MKFVSMLFLVFGLLLSRTVPAVDQPIFPVGEKAKNVHHTGDVWLTHLSQATDEFDYNIVVARFAPQAKLDWHLHPAGQQLLILEGKGYYQERGKPVQVVHKGEVISCTQGVPHWHGSAIDAGVTYLAISGNKPTQWLEPVSDKQYLSVEPNIAKTDQEESQEDRLVRLSRQKWQWMADKQTEPLDNLFDTDSMFIHMGGSWGKQQELDIIESGRIHYKQAEIHEVSIRFIDDTAILLNRITLLAVVGGNEVSNDFMVTEVYTRKQDGWKLGSMSFTKLI